MSQFPNTIDTPILIEEASAATFVLAKVLLDDARMGDISSRATVSELTVREVLTALRAQLKEGGVMMTEKKP